MGIEWDVKEDFCKECGKILRHNEKRCPVCGAPQCKSEIKSKKRNVLKTHKADLYPWGRVLLAIVYMKPEVQVIKDCEGCMIEDCNDCNFEYIEREAYRQSALKRMKKPRRVK